MAGEFRPCAIVPTYDNPATIRRVVEGVREKLSDVVVVDDGSGPEARAELEAIEREGLAKVVRRAENGGKGAAVKAGLALASRLGFTHALQIDADLQHDVGDIPRFLAAARDMPGALVLGSPVFDASVDRGRLAARQITRFWTHLETGGRVIADPMCGFRVYPIAPTLAVRAGNRMDFDIQVAVKLVWRGLRVVNLPTRVRYLKREEGGVSHFRLFRDNVRISWAHTRLVVLAVVRVLLWPWRRRFR